MVKKMVIQKTIQVHDTTHDLFRIVKLKFSVKKERQLSDNDFTLFLLEDFIIKEKLVL